MEEKYCLTKVNCVKRNTGCIFWRIQLKHMCKLQNEGESAAFHNNLKMSGMYIIPFFASAEAPPPFAAVLPPDKIKASMDLLHHPQRQWVFVCVRVRVWGGGSVKSFVLQRKKKKVTAAAAVTATGVGTLHLSRQIGCGTPPDWECWNKAAKFTSLTLFSYAPKHVPTVPLMVFSEKKEKGFVFSN